MQKYFKVSAQWMKACGMGNEATVFPVKTVDTNMVGGKGFDAFVILDCTNSPHVLISGMNWTVAAARGEFVDAPAAQPESLTVLMDRELAARRAAKAAAQPVATLADVPAFVKAERAAKYARWAKEEIMKAVVEADDPPEEIRATAVSFLACRLALSDGLTLMQVGEAHTTLAEKLVAEIPLYAAGWTHGDTQYFDDANVARRYIADMADEPVDGVDPKTAWRHHMECANALKSLSGDNGNEVTLYGVSYFVKKV